MEEAAEWSKEYLTTDEVKHKDKYSSFKHASDPETYSVPNYYEYIPANVRNAEEKYEKNSCKETLMKMNGSLWKILK